MMISTEWVPRVNQSDWLRENKFMSIVKLEFEKFPNRKFPMKLLIRTCWNEGMAYEPTSLKLFKHD